MKYVFISHRNKEPDRGITNRLYDYLSENKLAAWYDKGLHIGDWPKQISEKLRGASVYILVASKNSLTSEEVVDEIGMMRKERSNNKKLLIFAIDDYYFHMDESTADYFLGSNRNQAVILSNYLSEEEAFAAVVNYLKDELEELCNNPDDFVVKDKVLLSYKGKDMFVSVPGGIKEIGEYAFSGNEAVNKIKIPDSVENIQRMAFMNCKNLTDMEGMNGVRVCDPSAFLGSGIVIDERTNFSVCGVLFGGQPRGDVLTVPVGTKTIAARAFIGCDAKKIEFPDGLKNIGAGAFKNCFGITEVEFPASLEFIGKNAFANCYALKKAVFGGKIPEQAKEAFDDIKMEEIG